RCGDGVGVLLALHKVDGPAVTDGGEDLGQAVEHPPDSPGPVGPAAALVGATLPERLAVAGAVPEHLVEQLAVLVYVVVDGGGLAETSRASRPAVLRAWQVEKVPHGEAETLRDGFRRARDVGVAVDEHAVAALVDRQGGSVLPVVGRAGRAPAVAGPGDGAP